MSTVMTKPNDEGDHVELDQSTDSINRRGVLKTLGAASGTAFVATRQASAVGSDLSRWERKERAEEVREKYSDVATIRHALKEHTAEFIRGLYEEGYLSEAGLAQFKLDRVRTLEEVLDEGEGVTVDSRAAGNGEFEADITLHASTQNGEIEIHTVPGTGRVFAIENPRDKDERTPITQTTDGPAPAIECTTKEECVYTGSCGSGYYDDYDNIYTIDCCTNGECYPSKTTECCTDGSCNNDPCCFC